MKKKYAKYFVFLMVSFLTTGFFIGKVSAAGMQCSNVTPSLTGNLQYRSTKWGGHALNPDAWGVHTFWTIKISGTSAFCMDYQKHLNSKTSLNVIDCKDAQIKSSTTGGVNLAKKAAKYCAGKSCSDVNSVEYVIAQSYAWGFTEIQTKAEVCSKLYNYGTGAINPYKRKQIIACMTSSATDDEDESQGTGSKLHQDLDKKIQNIYYGIAHTSISNSDSFTCWQSSDGSSQPLIAYKKTTCEEQIFCTDSTGSHEITKCVSDCMTKDKKIKAVCKDECTKKYCPNQPQKFYCPPDSDKGSTVEITECVEQTGDITQCELDNCYDSTKQCKGFAYGYVGPTPVCTYDGYSQTVTYVQEPIGKATNGFSGDKENGILIKKVGKYGALYCRETAASVSLPSGLTSSIHLGGYLIWPTYSSESGQEILDSTFGNMYPLSFMGTMECHYQVAPHIYTGQLCNTNYSEDYKEAFEGSTVKGTNGLLQSANSNVTQARNGVTQVDKISGNNEVYNLGKYFGDSSLTLSARNNDSTGHTREYIRNFNSNGITTQVCNAPEVATPDDTNENVENITNRFVLSDELEIVKGTSATLLSADNWEIFVINSEALKKSNKVLANANKIFDFSTVKLDTIGTYKFTMRYEIGTASPSNYSASLTGYIKVVNELTTTSEKAPSYSLSCKSETLKTGNKCNNETKSGCADDYFDILENWREDNYDYWKGMYNKRLNTCKDEKRDGPCKSRDPVTNKCTSRDRISKGVSWCKANDNLTKTYASRMTYWSSSGTVENSIQTAKSKFNTYADYYNIIVNMYMELWNISYNQDLHNCVDSDTCSVYNFETSALLKYEDETNTEYPTYGHSLKIANEDWKYHCNINGTNSGPCGETPLVTMYPGLKGDDKFNYSKWVQAIYSLGYNWLVDKLKPTEIDKIVKSIEDTSSIITTDRIDYKLDEAQTYHYINKSSLKTEYMISLPVSSNINFIPLKYTSGVLPTSYKNKPGTEYKMELNDITLGNAWSGLNMIGNGNDNDISTNSKINYQCKYKVTNDSKKVCPPGTKWAGLRLDLATIYDIMKKQGISYEQAEKEYCNPETPLICIPDPCDYCVNSDGAKVDISACLESNGGNRESCEKIWCPSGGGTKSRYYCPDDSKKYMYANKEITYCVQRGVSVGKSITDSLNDCIEEECNSGKLFIYRTIDLKNPFPSIDADETYDSAITTGSFNLTIRGRRPGFNWFGGYLDKDNTTNQKYSSVYTKIIHNRNVDDYEVYNKEPLYHFELDTATIRKVREYNAKQVQNKKGGYADFNLTCMQNENNATYGKYVGIACVSNFLHGNQYAEYNKGFIKGKSQCGNANTPSQLVKCLYEDKSL